MYLSLAESSFKLIFKYDFYETANEHSTRTKDKKLSKSSNYVHHLNRTETTIHFATIHIISLQSAKELEYTRICLLDNI